MARGTDESGNSPRRIRGTMYPFTQSKFIVDSNLLFFALFEITG